MKKSIIVLLTTLIPIMGVSQDINEVKRADNPKKHLIKSGQQINQLHEGSLLIRLKHRKKSIAALRSIGKAKAADKIEDRQRRLNKAIIHAFKERFDFCPVYFFFSDHSQSVMEQQFEQVEFLNPNLSPDKTITIGDNGFLLGEYGTIEQDTTRYFNGYYYVQSENGLERRKRYNTSGTNSGFGALNIKNDQFIQLARPFPYYVRTFDSFPIKRKPEKVVKKMNRKLHRFYESKNNKSENETHTKG